MLMGRHRLAGPIQGPSDETRPARPADASLRAVLFGILLAVMLAGIDGTVVGVAMPFAVADLGGADLYAWGFAAYMLATAVTMPTWGAGSDRWGRRRTFLIGIGIFVAGSVACGLAGNMTLFILARAIQGIGVGALYSVPMTILGVAFPPERRARAFGIISAAWGISSVAGPLVGAAIVSYASWRWVFMINVPVGIVAAVLVARGIRETYGDREGRFDLLGSALAGAGAASILYAAVSLGEGKAGTLEAVLALAGAALLVLFVLVERRAPSPALPLDFFKRRGFAAGVAASALASFVAFGIMAFLPLDVSRAFGDTRSVAFVLGAFAISWSGAGLLAGRLVHLYGERVFIAGGMVVLGAGTLGLGLATGGPLAWLAAWAAMAGLGMGIMTPALTTSVQNAVEVRRLGRATGAMQFMRQMGAALGTGIFGLLYGAYGLASALYAMLLVVALGLAAALLVPHSLKRPQPAGSDEKPAMPE